MEMKMSNKTIVSVGISLGSTTFTMTELGLDADEKPYVIHVISEEHQGDPKGLFSKYIDDYDFTDKFVCITGRKFRNILNFKSIIEPEAVEYAYEYFNKDNKKYDAIVSAGGETFMIYDIDNKGKVSGISSGNKCASGTGEFFMQQIKRMNIGIDEAIHLAQESSSPHHLSGRCSVFCKSDCTHALNKGESISDVAAGLSKMIAGKIEDLLIKVEAKDIIIVGGTARNPVVINFLSKKFNSVVVPDSCYYFESLGAALWALKNKHSEIPEKNDYYRPRKASFDTHKPIHTFSNLVRFEKTQYATPKPADEVIIGLDVGSTTTKAVLIRTSDLKIVKSIYLRTNGSPVTASQNCYKSLKEQLAGINVTLIGVGVTGSGRYIAGLHADTSGIINEIIAHARAASHFDSEVDTIFEIGGQDAKYTFLTNGVASDYAMNEACAAGTGSFLEESAYEQLGVKMEDISAIALAAANPPNFSDQCSAFISSDINTAFQEGVIKEDIIAGLVYSICINYMNRVKGARQTGKKVFMQGGVCYNRAIPIAMAGLLGREIIVPPEPGLMGAFGVALEVSEMIHSGLLSKKEFNLDVLINRQVKQLKPFICQGTQEQCDRRCEIAMIEIDSKKIPFGGACNKYYNLVKNIHVDIKTLNHVEKRKELLYKEWDNAPRKNKENAPVVGLNPSFQINTFLPMFFTFFNELGCKVIMSDKVIDDAISKGTTSYCLSAQIALGLFADLIDKKPDYIFMPQIMEVHVSKQDDYRKEFQTVCMFVQGEPFYQKQTFLRDKENAPIMLTPAINFMRGIETEEDVFVKTAQDMGFSANAAKKAYSIAVAKQNEFFQSMKEEGKKILHDLKSNPTKTAVVLFGRPYNAFDDRANKGVPFKFASRNIEIIPYDFLEYENEENYKETYWEMGQRIIKAARIVKRNPQLFGCYLTNFLCALDSMMIPHFRDLLGTKPSLTIEVDTHTADAGVNTRIEAFMDVVKNYLIVKDRIVIEKNNFKRAEAKIDSKGKAWYIDSDGKKLPITDKSIKIVIPSMGDFFNTACAASLRGAGWNAHPLPECDREALDLGRAVTTNKECLPILNIVGEMLKYLKYRTNPDERLAIFLISAGGCCRVGQYHILTKTVIEKLQLKNVAVITLANDDGYAGLGVNFRLNIAKLMYAGDIFDDMRSAIKVLAVNKETGIETLMNEWDNVLSTIDGRSKRNFWSQLSLSSGKLSQLQLKDSIKNAQYIGIVGEIFVRRDHFSLMGIPDKLADEGFIMLDSPVMEWIRYVDFLKKMRMFDARVSFTGKIEEIVSNAIQVYYEKRIKKILAKSGLYEYELIDIQKYMEHSKHVLPYTLTGEPGLSTGASLYNIGTKYAGVINVGPFGCMNSRLTEAVAPFEMTIDGKIRAVKEAGGNIDYTYLKENIDILPFLSVESDGNPFSQIMDARFETFILQANRLAEEMKKNTTKYGNTGKRSAT